jgi:hypothetical protein
MTLTTALAVPTVRADDVAEGPDITIVDVNPTVKDGVATLAWTDGNDGDAASDAFTDEVTVRPIDSCDSLMGAKGNYRIIFTKQVKMRALAPLDQENASVTTPLKPGFYRVAVEANVDAGSDSSRELACLVVPK